VKPNRTSSHRRRPDPRRLEGGTATAPSRAHSMGCRCSRA